MALGHPIKAIGRVAFVHSCPCRKAFLPAPGDFARPALARSVDVAWKNATPIGADLFAEGIREAVTYGLHFLAPEIGTRPIAVSRKRTARKA